MTYKMHRIFVLCLLLVISLAGEAQGFNCSYCITVSSEDGKDNLSCLQRNVYSPHKCKSLGYALSNSLSDLEVVLQGDQWINETLSVSNTTGLTIRGEASTIKCSCPHSAEDGCGIVFINVSRLIVSEINFEGCGTLQYSTTVRNYVSVKYRSAVYIINSTDIHFSETTFHRNIGKALSMHDVDGVVVIRKSVFTENMVPPEEETLLFGGGSIYIEFTYCSPGYFQCDPASNNHNKHSRYLISNCSFEGNRATNGEVTNQSHIVQFRILPGSDGNNAGQGGGLHVIIKGSSFNNSVTVENCRFYNNSAVYGGGIDAIFLDNANHNSFETRNSVFENNHAPDRGGGALQLAFCGVETVTHNSISIVSTKFRENAAAWGAAAAFFSSLSPSEQYNSLTFTDCWFEGNAASIGAAIAIQPKAFQHIYEGSAPAALFCDCTFVKNEVLENEQFLNIAHDGISQHVVESGIIDLESLQIDLSENVSFIENTGSAVVANSGQINVLENGEVTFLKNTATNGGAMALLGYSVLELHPGSHIVFDSNIAHELGGAVYATSAHQSEFIFSHKCFISFNGVDFNDPNKWNTTLIFTNNSAKYGYSIFTDSVFPCVKQVGSIITDVSAAFTWKSFKISPAIEQYTIATSPAAINFTLPPSISPGESISLNPTSLDDLTQPIPSSFKVSLRSTDGSVRTNAFIAEDGHLQIRGNPGTNFNLTLLTQNTRHISATMAGRLVECPIGFVLEGDTCVCSTGTSAKLVGVIGCDIENFRALLQVGYWIGCSGSKILTGLCPLSYCSYDDASATGLTLVSRTCEELEELSFCSDNRRGQLCGECEKGYTAYFHSEKFSCGKCDYGALGLLIYFVAELIPLVIVFVLVMALDLNITSGLMQSFLLFSQTLFILNHVPSFRPLSNVTLTFISIHTLIVGFFNLYFFHMDEISFCLWKGATILDTLAFRYVTTLFTIFLLVLFVMAVNQGVVNAESLFTKFNIPNKIMKKIKVQKGSIIHGISAFLIFSYTQYTLTSMQIINKVPVYRENGEIDQNVAYLQGNLEYFGINHLPYAIPAVLVLIFLSLPPPLVLVAYPFLWNIKAKLKKSDSDTTPWLIRKLLPIIDSFQGVFRDNYRMFAGLFFLWRFIITAISTFCFYTV